MKLSYNHKELGARRYNTIFMKNDQIKGTKSKMTNELA